MNQTSTLKSKEDSTLVYVTTQAMSLVWGKVPNSFQREVIPHIISMHHCQNDAKAILLVQGTGGGKSMVYQCSGTILTGVALVVESTLSLSSDQCSKIKNASNAHGPVKAIQLDTITSTKMISLVTNNVKQMEDNADDSTLFIFSSPEKILKPCWKSLFEFLTLSKILSMVVVDEAHQFVTFGSSFRSNFLLLKEHLFSKLILSHHCDKHEQLLRVPALFMTATLNEELLDHLQRMTDMCFYPHHVFWAKK